MAPRTIRWGILATGGIAVTFSRDLLVDPTTRGVTDVKHDIVAAASSSSQSRAQDFLKTVGASQSAKAYGSYAELAADPAVEIIYVATPHSHHYQNTMLCLLAGKPVLCEKSFTTNAAQLARLIEVAREHDVLLMEAFWTRYFPLSEYVREVITSGRIGTVHRVIADMSDAQDPDETYAGGLHRMVNPDLAGGALLDLGIYALMWCFQTVFLTQQGSTQEKAPPTVLAAVKKYRPTNVDEQTTVLLNFPRPEQAGGDVHAIAMTSLRVGSAVENVGPCCRVFGTKGEIQVMAPGFRPERTRLWDAKGNLVEEKRFVQPGPGVGSGWYNGFLDGRHGEGVGHGMFWEADEAARALVEGRKNGGKYLDLDESLIIMKTVDEVRRQGNFTFPQKIETLDYPTDL